MWRSQESSSSPSQESVSPWGHHREAESVTHTRNVLTAWWECITEEHIRIHHPFPACTSLQRFSLFPLRSASFSGSFICSLPLEQPCFEKSPLHHTLLNPCAARVYASACACAPPFKFLLWQTDLLRRVIHTPRSRLRPTSLRTGTDKSAGLPNHTLLQGLVLCHVLTSHFGLHASHGWLLAYRFWCSLKWEPI